MWPNSSSTMATLMSFQPFLRFWVNVRGQITQVDVYVRFQPFLRFWIDENTGLWAMTIHASFNPS